MNLTRQLKFLPVLKRFIDLFGSVAGVYKYHCFGKQLAILHK